ncbi:IspD/TarI family cytidylyltransferase, partial [Enterobacter ludwigii]|uniref:IspD/TarI family cytidylyltransferase n=1 Tax=Enterobacter ludwigii TaxID=299767 RepID=UPI0019537EA8
DGRVAGDGIPKQYRPIGGKPLLAHASAVFAGHPAITTVRVVIDPADAALYAESIAAAPALGPPVPGGATRQASVLAGLAALAQDPPD